MGINGSTYNDPDYSAMKALDGYLYVHGSLNSSADGNLIIGTASAGANVVITPGGTTTENVVAHFTKNGLVLQNSAQVEFTDGSIQTVAAAPANYTQSAFDTANTSIALQAGINATQNSQISILQGVNLTQNTNITAVNNFAAAAFTKANNALANTSGTFAGNLNVTGNIFAGSISSTQLVSFVGSTTPATNSLVELIGSSSGLQQAPSQDGYMLHITGKDNIPTRVIFDAFGANSYPIIAGRKGRGVAGTPTATANGDILLRISGNGWGTTGFAPLGSGRIDFVATENYTDAARGSRIDLFNCADGSNTIVRIATFNSDSVEFTGSVKPDKGFVYIPRVLTGPQTAITVDFANDSIIKASLTADLTISFTNYTYGKIVEVWLTNTGGTTRTVTHGCSATNSSENSTTFAIPGTSSAYLKYFSIDGDLANTFVTSVHA